MRVYAISLIIGLCVGGLYGALGVRSPAPPVVALVGLLGILIGEQLVPWIRHRTFDHYAVTHISDHRVQAKPARANGNGS
jgi:XapX domain-containing protein